MEVFSNFLFTYSISIFSQNKENELDYKISKSDSAIVAIFPKGSAVFRKMISENFNMDKINLTKDISCKVIFIVEKNGEISNIKAEGSDEKFNKEAVLAVSKIKDIWIPASLYGEKVRYRFSVPLDIKVD